MLAGLDIGIVLVEKIYLPSNAGMSTRIALDTPALGAGLDNLLAIVQAIAIGTVPEQHLKRDVGFREGFRMPAA
ncbi:hypothetical protein [Bradyrhizobium sp. DASA03120]|uniref:hypothetical protein n=1 Tax=Bradyrhizobium sp. SMVTL-02 TaxID=3395917 RepID=UPI003F71CF11